MSIYEADAMLAHLESQGLINLIITEDSDLTVFGCQRVLYKLDFDGHGVLYTKDLLPNCLQVVSKPFDFENFLKTAILSGCDYLPSIRNVGLARAKIVVDAANQTNANISQVFTFFLF